MNATAQTQPISEKSVVQTDRHSKWVTRVLQYMDVCCFVVLLLAIATVAAFYWLDFNPCRLAFRERQLIAYAAVVVVLAWVFSVGVFRYVLQIRSTRFILCYPSSTLVVIAIMGLSWGLIPAELVERQFITESYLVFGAAILLRGVLHRVKWVLLTHQGAKDEPNGLPPNLVWLGSESPVTKLEDDRFQHKGLVLRLADLVGNNKCRSFGLTGPHGSGKSSVIRMVKTVLDARVNSPFFVFFRRWGGRGEDLTKCILDSIVEALNAEGVEVVSLLSWPSEYARNVVGESSVWSRFIGCCLREQQTSRNILARLDPVLSAIDKKIVVVIEDVDRGESGDGMDMLCQLLSDFAAVENVSFFFLKSDETKACFDFHRLCEHTEMMPQLNFETIAAKIDDFLKTCESISGSKLVFFKERNDIRRVAVERCLGESIHGGNVFPDAICLLAQTPRVLKHALRRGWLMWRNLTGEIDLLELVVYVLLREGCPVGFQFLKDNLSALRTLPKHDMGEEKKNGAIIDMRERLASLGLESESTQAVKVVLTLLNIKLSLYNTEAYYLSLEGGRTGGNLPDTLQGVALKEPTDYFRRMEAGYVSEGETPDQGYLHAIWDYARGLQTELPTKLATDVMWGAKLQQFKVLIRGSRSLDLLSDYIEASGRIHRGSARMESPGFEPVHEIMKGCDFSEYPEFLTRLGDILISALQFSLELAHAIYYRYTYARDSSVTQPLRKRWVEGFRELVESDSGYLASAVDPSYPYAIYHTLRFREEYPCFNKASDWQWLAPHLCASMRIFPAKVTPDIVRLFVRDKQGAGDGRAPLFEFESKYFEEMCDSPRDRVELVSLLLKYGDAHSDNDPAAFGIRYVRGDLAKYCKDVVSKV